MEFEIGEKESRECCGSTRFASLLSSLSPFPSLHDAILAARDIWLNKVDVNGWLEAFAAHPQIGQSPSSSDSRTSAQLKSLRWSKGEQSTAISTASDLTLQELSEWNARYKEKFGFIFIICASGRTSAEILAELKRRYSNRPIVEFEIAAQEQMKIIELRLSKHFVAKSKAAASNTEQSTTAVTKAEEDRMSIIGGHLTAATDSSCGNESRNTTRTCPPITTHVLDVSRGYPASGVEVLLEMWKGSHPPLFGQTDSGSWVHQSSSTTNSDGRSGHLMNIVDAVEPGVYRISFNTGKYCPSGFFPFVSVVFVIRENQKLEHFHVPLLFSPFSFSTYRGS